ncbi:dicarboxylate/amino acid:cation symporter [Anaerolentibacter hominis]|uniref:dicarboxylate/amino acid:cation symporter n=1 Tax=Anaerolentibacter hominis TaxID=3079009 RepID=UPI0031B845CE
MKKIVQWYKTHTTTAIFIGLLLGIVVGLFVAGRFEKVLVVTDLVGGIYMSALQMMIFPMVFCSIVVGIASIGNMKTTGKIGGQAILYFVVTTAMASILGLVIPRLIGLGKGVQIEMAAADVEATKFTSLLDTLKSLIPSNPVASFTQGNMLQVLVFAVIFGFAVLAVGEKGKAVLNVIDSLNEICMKIVTVVMKFTPFGVFCTIVPVVHSNGISTILSLSVVLIACYLAFFGHSLIVYGGAAKLIGKMKVGHFFKAIMPAALNAFGTCSSSATIPISKKCAEDGLGVSNKITSLVLPLGATINMDAVSILMSFMIMFFANACGVHVSISMMIVILLSNVLLSIGTPGIPGGAIASFAALSSIAGLPAGVMGVYISINTLCDMGATCANVMGDLACCAVLNETLDLD